MKEIITLVKEENFSIEAEITADRALVIKEVEGGRIEHIGLDLAHLKVLVEAVEYVSSIKSKAMYKESLQGYTVMWGEPVEIIGEQEVEHEGKLLEQYLYNKVGYTPANGKPFVSLKANIALEK